MAIKFNSLTFDLKDLILICGIVAAYFNFKSEQKEMFNQLKAEIQQIVSASTIAAKYNEIIDRESAFEILNSKLKATEEQEEIKQVTKKSTKEEKSTIEKLSEKVEVA